MANFDSIGELGESVAEQEFGPAFSKAIVSAFRRGGQNADEYQAESYAAVMAVFTFAEMIKLAIESEHLALQLDADGQVIVCEAKPLLEIVGN